MSETATPAAPELTLAQWLDAHPGLRPTPGTTRDISRGVAGTRYVFDATLEAYVPEHEERARNEAARKYESENPRPKA